MATTTTTSNTEIPTWISDPLKRLYTSAEGLTSQPYPTYTGDRIAPFNADQNTAFAGIQSLPMMGQAQTLEGADWLRQSGQDWTQTNQSAYMNPYMQAAINPTLNRMTEDWQKYLQSIGGQAASNNAFGGARQALLEAAGARDYNRNIGETMATGLSNAYQSGMGQFNADQGRRYQTGMGISGVGQQLQSMGLAGYDALLRSGGVQQDQTNANLNLAYNDFNQQRDWPYGQLSWLNSIITGYPNSGSVQTSKTNTPDPSGASQWLGAGLAGISLIDKIAGWV